ncbi:MAG: hypothetical protein IPM81_20300 [Saprospirales bacterium]|nr:hypothetical protein [Saprospirales bacterium]
MDRYKVLSMWSVCLAQRSGLVHQMVHFESGKAYEAEAVRQLVEKLGLKGAIFTLDALHCQKKR